MLLRFSPKMPYVLLKSTFLCLFCVAISLAQSKKSRQIVPQIPSSQPATPQYDKSLYAGLEWRSIGPFRGGRSGSVTGVNGQPNLFYMATTGGGLWKTTDSGTNWNNVSDGYFGGSIGAVAVAESDPNVIYVGEGENTVRGNVSSGWGMWKSTDAGKTWASVGLKNTFHIARVRIHPKNPDVVYVAAMGNLYKSNEERGIYRTKDGGKTWERVLFANADAGGCDLLLDPNNPRIIYATTWRIRRTPHSMESGGEGSAIWKSTDGGDNWTNISANDGLPKGVWGISGVAVSPQNSERVWAIIENENGGVFRSDNAGKTWTKINDDRALRQRAWYYTRIYADPKNVDLLYCVNVNFLRSKDGGKTFETMPGTPHGDHHDLWINPEEPNRMAVADDGGAQISTDAGQSWSTYMNQPTAQFYRVTTDNSFPYRIYVAQQDNSTLRIRHRTTGAGITEKDWEVTAGGESGHIAVDPLNNDIVYGGSYDGLLTRTDHSTGLERDINVWPDNPMGHGAEDYKFRFQWNFPIFFSPHDPKKLYAASNHLHATTNEGQSWATLSPDLTRNDVSKMGSSGGPITKDNTSVEYYGTIFAALESPYEKDLLWTGSDDGRVNVSRDGGKNWENVTPPANIMPNWTMINSMEAHPFVKGCVYVAATAYKSGDFRPYLYKVNDYGKTWTKITDGIADSHFTRVVRADPKRAGLLYAGTEYGMYVSFDEGTSWQPFQMNLPVTPITDLIVKENNLIAATQGRSLWLIDDLSPLHQLHSGVAAADFHLYKPLPAYRYGRPTPDGAPSPKNMGKNHPGGLMLYYNLKEKPDSTLTASLEIMESNGKLIKKYDTKSDKKEDKLVLKQGLNRFVWNMRYADASTFEGLILWGGGVAGPTATPGSYRAKMTVNGKTQEVPFEIVGNPLAKTSLIDYQAQFDFLMNARNKLTETHDAIKQVRAIRKALNGAIERVSSEEDKKELQKMAKELDGKMTQIEEKLYQTKNRSGQDPLNFPIRLNNKLASVASDVAQADFAPTDAAVQVKTQLTQQIDEQLGKLKALLAAEVPKFNELVKAKNIPAVTLPKEAGQ